MSETRDNHYVPQWHQKGFMNDRPGELWHLKQKPIELPDGTTKIVFSKKLYKPPQCFYKKDLYTTFFGMEISDAIERRLFGNIDDNGSVAVRAFLANDQAGWHKNFENFFIYLDAQKLRTPKGLDWIKSKYPTLKQNELMREMQAIRTIHCTLWAESVRELVSAEESEIKFIVSDHPVTVYNYAAPPNSELCFYPNDPDISLKATQTIFALDKNRCLILTNLEYAKNPETNPLEQRTNANKMRRSMVNTIEFINSRKLRPLEVLKINHIIKSRSKESVAAGSDSWLTPENNVDCEWAELRHVLMPPSNELYRYGGEMVVRFKDGHTHYQDAFGRTNGNQDFLNKIVDENSIRPNDRCGCGSGKKYKKCCDGVPRNERTTWSVISIRERNLALCNAINDILGLNKGKTWADVRREITTEQICDIYRFYSIIWPQETDIYSLLPKSDKKFRALYSGPLDARTIGTYALGISTHFDEFLIQNPMLNPNNTNPEFNPLESPQKYKYQALKDFIFILTLEPFIATGLVNLFPDPGEFDLNLKREMMVMARSRREPVLAERDRKLMHGLMVEDLLNTIHTMPRDVKARMLIEEFGITKQFAEETIDTMEASAATAPLIMLQPLTEGGQFMMSSMGPNYEMALYIAQVTGSIIVTDSESRWLEFQSAQHRNQGIARYPWSNIYNPLQVIPIDYEAVDHFKKSSNARFVKLREFLKMSDELVASNDMNSDKINRLIRKVNELVNQFRSAPKLDFIEIKVLSPEGGFYDATVHRLLLKSNCQQYGDRVRSVYLLS
jgi:hypothetical protein